MSKGEILGLDEDESQRSADKLKAVTTTPIDKKRALDVLSKGKVNDHSSTAWIEFTVDTGTNYDKGDIIDVPKKICGALSKTGAQGYVFMVEVQDNDSIAPNAAHDLDLLFYESTPVATSPDNAALAMNQANLDKRQCRVRVRLGHWESETSDHSIAEVALPDQENGGALKRVQSADGGDLGLILQARSEINYTTATAIKVRVSIAEI